MKFLVTFPYSRNGSSAVVEGDREYVYELLGQAVAFGAGDTLDIEEAEEWYKDYYGHEPPFDDDEDCEDETLWDFMADGGYDWFDPPAKFVDTTNFGMEPVPPNAQVGLIEPGKGMRYERYGANRVRR